MVLQYAKFVNHINHQERIIVVNANNVYLEWIIIVCGSIFV